MREARRSGTGYRGGAWAGATHPGRDPQQGLGPPREAHRVQGGPCASRAERGSLHGQPGRAACPRRPLSFCPSGRPHPRPPGAAADAASAAAAVAAFRECAPAAAGARGAGPSLHPSLWSTRAGLEHSPPSTLPTFHPTHPLSPQDQGPRWRPSARSPSGGGVKGLSPPRPLTSSQESAGQVDTGLSLCRSHVGGQTDMTPLLCTGPFPECLRR